MNIGYKIKKDFKRVNKEILEKFKNIPIPNIDDVMNRTAALSSDIKAMNNTKMIGTAYTVRVPAGDNLLFYYAIDQAKAGDVIVIDGGGYTERALCGEIMANYAQKRGLSGFVIDGAIRDKIEISQMNFPVFAKSSTPNGPYKNGPGEINVPVCVGGRLINPGDIIVGDINGIISFSPNQIENILEEVEKIMIKENKLMKGISENGVLDLKWVYEKLIKDKCEFVE